MNPLLCQQGWLAGLVAPAWARGAVSAEHQASCSPGDGGPGVPKGRKVRLGSTASRTVGTPPRSGVSETVRESVSAEAAV